MFNSYVKIPEGKYGTFPQGGAKKNVIKVVITCYKPMKPLDILPINYSEIGVICIDLAIDRGTTLYNVVPPL